MYFPHDLPARYCLTFLMRCCLSLKVAFRFTLKALFTVYSFSLSWSICFLFLCSLIYIPPANRSWGYYTIALCSNSMVFRLAVEAAASLPSSFPPQEGMERASITSTVLLLLSLSVWDCVFANASASHSCHLSFDQTRIGDRSIGVALPPSTYLLLGGDQPRCRWRYPAGLILSGTFFLHLIKIQQTKASDMGTQVVWVFFFKARRCSRSVHLSLKSHRGMLLFVLFVFQLFFVCVCAFVPGESGGWVTPGGQAPAHFLSLSCSPQSGEALSPAIYLPALRIVIPKYRPVNISLVTATSPPPRNTPGKRKGKKKREKKMNREGDAPCSRCSFAHISLSPKEAQIHDDRKKCHLFLFYLALHVICLIKHWCSFNKTQPLFSGSNSRQTLQVEKDFLYIGQFWWILTDQNIHLCILTYLIRKLHLHI